jgi:hypothetical protein
MSTPGSTAAHVSPARRRRTRRRGAPLGLRLRVLAQRGGLDRRLLAGADPVSTPELTLRAFQLTRAASRTTLAGSFEDTIATATERRRRSATSAPLARGAIAAARLELAELVLAIREEPVVRARGLVLARRLLTDGSGPLYVESSDAALRIAVDETIRALLPRL